MNVSDQQTPPPSSHQDAARRQEHRWAILLAVAGFLGVCVLSWLVYRFVFKAQPKAAPVAVAIPVSVEAVKLGNIDIYLDGLGTVTPMATVTITSRVSGVLMAVPFQEGQIVHQGDLLAQVDPGPYQAMVLQAQGQLDRDQALLDNARIDLARYQAAYDDKSNSGQVLHAVTEQTVATQKALVDQDTGVVKLDQGNLNAAQLNLVYTRIVSPIEGQAGLRLIDVGNNVVANGTAGLVTIAQIEPITVIFTLAEDHIPDVVAATAAGKTLRVDALDRDLGHTLAQGTLITLDVQINPTTGTVRARATFPNLRHELFPNQFVNARLYTKTLTGVNLAPTAAIQLNGDTSFVYVVQADGTVKSTNVTIAASEGDVAAVTGVNPGDKLVTDGFDKLQSGVKVAVRKPKAAPQPANPADPAHPATTTGSATSASTTDSAAAPAPAAPATTTTKTE